MDSGFRVDDSGRQIPKNIIHTVRAYLNDRLIMEADLGTAIDLACVPRFPSLGASRGRYRESEFGKTI